MIPELTADSGGDAAGWAGEHRDQVRAAVTEHGALLIRRLGLREAAAVAAVARRLTDTVMDEREGFAKRDRPAPGVYASSAWPADHPMCMHHELSYARVFPGTMMFACLAMPDSGGEIDLADAVVMAGTLPAGLVEDFARDGWRLTRTYHPETGTPWQEAFGTDDPAVVEAYCAGNGITYQWGDDGLLRTWQRQEAFVKHPVTGGRCWFNQIAFLSEWTMDKEIREYLLYEYGPDGLPFNTGYGDGRPIDAAVVEELNAAYERQAVPVAWQPGDLLVVDNVRTAHSRRAYAGQREVVVAMGDPIDRDSW